MNRQDFDNKLDQYRAGELSGAEAAAMEAFMFEDAAARRAHEADEALGGLLRQTLADYPPVSQERLRVVALRARQQFEAESAAGGMTAAAARAKSPRTWGLLEWLAAPLRQPELAAALAGVFVIGAAAGWGLRPQTAVVVPAPGVVPATAASVIPEWNQGSEVIQPVSTIQKSALLEDLQSMKYDMLASGNNPQFERLRQFEQNLDEIMPVSAAAADGGAASAMSQNLSLYHAGEEALLAGNTAAARGHFAQLRAQDKAGSLGLLATIHLANIAFGESEDFPQAMALYESSLNDYPPALITDQNKRDIQKKIELIASNTADDYRPLRLFNQARASKPDLARVHYEQLLDLYPNASVSAEAVDALLHFALDYPDQKLLPATDALKLFIVFVEKHPDSRLVPTVQVAMGDIYLYRVQRAQQALMLYTAALQKSKDDALSATVKSRLQYMMDNGLLNN